jgi:hypothetical protein
MRQPPGWSTGGPADWEDAYRALSAVAAEGEPSADDLDVLATAAYLTGRDEQGFDLWARAHRACLVAGEVTTAARFGIRLAECLAFKGDLARARGWVDRARHLLDDAEAETVSMAIWPMRRRCAASCRPVTSPVPTRASSTR